MEQQCKGKTKSGRRCKNRHDLKEGYCPLHRDQIPAAPDPAQLHGPSRQEPPPAARGGDPVVWSLLVLVFSLFATAVFFRLKSRK